MIGLYEGMIELSDNRVINDIWDYAKGPFEFDDRNLYKFNKLCDDMCEIFNKHYHTEIKCLGRSGRHICVENNTNNKRNQFYMWSSVGILQWLIVYIITDNEDVLKILNNINIPKWIRREVNKKYKIFN